MNEEEIVVEDNSNTSEDVVLNTTEDTSVDSQSNTEQTESVEEYKARLAKAEELASNYKIRAEKAEKRAKESPKTEKSSDTMSTADLVALMESKVASDDVGDVEEYAKFKKISIAEALKSPTLRAILNEKREFRTSANASNTAKARSSSSKLSDESLLEKVSNGEMPSSQDDLVRLIKLRKGIK